METSYSRTVPGRGARLGPEGSRDRCCTSQAAVAAASRSFAITGKPVVAPAKPSIRVMAAVHSSAVRTLLPAVRAMRSSSWWHPVQSSTNLRFVSLSGSRRSQLELGTNGGCWVFNAAVPRVLAAVRMTASDRAFGDIIEDR
jgi:hypothetical protein